MSALKEGLKVLLIAVIGVLLGAFVLSFCAILFPLFFLEALFMGGRPLHRRPRMLP